MRARFPAVRAQGAELEAHVAAHRFDFAPHEYQARTRTRTRTRTHPAPRARASHTSWAQRSARRAPPTACAALTSTAPHGARPLRADGVVRESCVARAAQALLALERLPEKPPPTAARRDKKK